MRVDNSFTSKLTTQTESCTFTTTCRNASHDRKGLARSHSRVTRPRQSSQGNSFGRPQCQSADHITHRSHRAARVVGQFVAHEEPRQTPLLGNAALLQPQARVHAEPDVLHGLRSRPRTWKCHQLVPWPMIQAPLLLPAPDWPRGLLYVRKRRAAARTSFG